MVDWIQANLIDQSRSRKNVVKKLHELGLGPAALPQAVNNSIKNLEKIQLMNLSLTKN